MENGQDRPSNLSLKQIIEATSILCGQRDDRQGLQSKIEGSEEEQSLLSKRLKWRLATFQSQVGDPDRIPLRESVPELQERTGQASLFALQLIHSATNNKNEQTSSSSSQPNDAPKLGSRDLQTIKILLGIVNSWNLGVLISSYDQILAEKKAPRNIPKLQEIVEEDETKKEGSESPNMFSQVRSTLGNTLSRLNAILSDKEKLGDSRTIRSLLLEVCSAHILAAGIRIGWGPMDLQSMNPRLQDEIAKQGATMIVQLLKSMPTTTCLKTISAVTHIGKKVQFIKTTSEMLFSAQLIRPDGVMALLRNTFNSDDDGEERGMMKKLVSVGHLLSAPPPRMPLKVFASIVIPQLLEILGELPTQETDAKEFIPSAQSSSSQKNAACFALARLYDIIPTEVFHLMSDHVLHFINPSLGTLSRTRSNQESINETQIIKSIRLITEIVDQSEPSSKLANNILEQISIQLFVLHSFIKENSGARIQTIGEKGKQKQSEELGELAYNLLITWSRLTTLEESVKILSPLRKGLFALAGKPLGTLNSESEISDGLLPRLDKDKTGALCIRWGEHHMMNEEVTSTMSFNTLSLKDFNADVLLSKDSKDSVQSLPTAFLNSLNLFPSPDIFVQLLKRSERKDLASSIVIDLLDAYTFSRNSKSQSNHNENVLLDILYVQLILQLINTFGIEILQNHPEKVLIFIAFALGERSIDQSKPTQTEEKDVKLVKMEEDDDDDEIPFIKSKQESTSTFSGLLNINSTNAEKQLNSVASSSGEEEDEEDGEMIETALNLLLSLLEGDTKMTLESYSMLKVINAKVNALTTHVNETIRSLAKEASLVLKARQSSKNTLNKNTKTSDLLTKNEKAIMKGNEMYQEALKLLQDPILPVRAHGLIVLKELVSYGSIDDKANVEDKEGNIRIVMDSALIPAILDIFIQAICDDESFLYLNAVKGLAEMANSGGKMMIRKLISIYLGGSDDQTKITQAEIDKRLRIGEALLQVIQKLDLALAAYTNEIVQPLLNAIRQAHFSTTFRSSILSILGTCIEACPNAMAIQGHSKAICEGMLDLLSVEMNTKIESTSQKQKQQVDDALSKDTKLPQLRRAALLLLSLLIRGSSMQLQSFQEEQDQLQWQEEVPKLSQLRLPGGRVGVGNLAKIKLIPEKNENQISINQNLLFVPDQIRRTETVIGYLAQFDRDSLAQHQAGEILQDLETFKLYVVHSSIN